MSLVTESEVLAHVSGQNLTVTSLWDREWGKDASGPGAGHTTEHSFGRLAYYP